MATVIERPADRVIERREVVERDSGAGWAIALIVLVALIVAGFVWARYYGTPATQTPSTNINVSAPTPGAPNTGSAPNTRTTPNADSNPGNASGAGPNPMSPTSPTY